MFVYLCAKFEVSSIILTSFRGGRGGITPTSKRTPKKPTQIRVKEVRSIAQKKQYKCKGYTVND